MFVDCHIHQPGVSRVDPAILDDEVRMARESGAGAWIVTGVTVEESRQVLDFVKDREGFFACVGIHPSRSDHFNDDSIQQLADLAASSPKVVGIGEIGIDYERSPLPVEMQQRAFRAQVRLARELGLPVNLHTYGRESAYQLIEALNEERAWETGGVLHNFMGNDEMVRRLMDMGIYSSVSVVIMHPQANRLRGVLRNAPLGNLVMDTDWPAAILEGPGASEAPFDLDKKTSLVNLRRFAERLAAEKDVPVEQIMTVTGMNTLRAFPRMAAALSTQAAPATP